MKRHKSTPKCRRGPRPHVIERASVIGLDGVDRQVAMQLAAIGVPWLQLIDPAIVSNKKQTVEGYAWEDIDRPKVHAVAQLCHQLNPKVEIHTVRRRSLQGLDLGNVVFCCSGSAAALHALRHRVSDLSMVVACCTVSDTAIHLSYTRTSVSLDVWPDEGACSRHPRLVPIHIATLAAGLLITEFTRFTTTGPAMRSIRFDLQNLDIAVEESA